MSTHTPSLEDIREKAMKETPQPWFPGSDVRPGKAITAIIYGKAETCLVLAVHPFGTIDVERSDGRCFRLTGMKGLVNPS